MKPEIENLKVWMSGRSTTGYQRALAMREFEQLLAYVAELEQLRQPLVIGNEVAFPFDKVTRLEVISYREGDKSGRVFTHWKDDNKIEGQLQDKDRTLKIFIDKRQ